MKAQGWKQRRDPENKAIWVRGPFEIRIVGVTANERPTLWGIFVNQHVWTSDPSDRFPRGRDVVYDRLSAAKRRCDLELVEHLLRSGKTCRCIWCRLTLNPLGVKVTR